MGRRPPNPQTRRRPPAGHRSTRGGRPPLSARPVPARPVASCRGLGGVTRRASSSEIKGGGVFGRGPPPDLSGASRRRRSSDTKETGRTTFPTSQSVNTGQLCPLGPLPSPVDGKERPSATPSYPFFPPFTLYFLYMFMCWSRLITMGTRPSPPLARDVRPSLLLSTTPRESTSLTWRHDASLNTTHDPYPH